MEHGKLDAYIGKALDAYRDGTADRASLIAKIGHLVGAIEKGNTGEVEAELERGPLFRRSK